MADVHALTEIKGPTEVDALSVEVAKNYIACGVDPEKCTLYRQSDVPEVLEIALLLGNIVNIGVLERCTTFKDRIHNLGLPRTQVSYGLLGYPVLMAADILCVLADRVPVGEDQTQHVEMARDFARAFNRTFGQEVFKVPEMNVSNPLRVPGIDGADKMGKSDGNTIALLEDTSAVRKKVMSIPTQVEPGGEMAPGTQALYTLVELCCPPDVHTDYLRRYTEREGKFFGEMKKRLADDVLALLEPIQERYHALSDKDVRAVLSGGAARVRPIAAGVLSGMRKAMGIN